MRAAFVFCLCAVAASAAIIDQLAVTVGNQAITQSQITNDLQLAALLNGTPLDNSLSARRDAASRLIEQALIRREMSFGSYPAIPEADVDEALAGVEKARGGAAAIERELTSYDLTLQDLREYLKWQLELLRFIDLRFRPAVQVTNEDIEKYYQENFAGAEPGKAAPELADVRSQIEHKLSGQRVDEQLDRWILQTRKHTTIRFQDAELEAPASGSVESQR
jgi:hypothetical protein